MQQTFDDKTKEDIVNAQNGYCAMQGCLNKIHSIHHKLKNSKYNRLKYPLFIHSPTNGIGLCYKCHRDNAYLFIITQKMADVFESFLQKLKEE